MYILPLHGPPALRANSQRGPGYRRVVFEAPTLGFPFGKSLDAKVKDWRTIIFPLYIFVKYRIVFNNVLSSGGTNGCTMTIEQFGLEITYPKVFF